MESIAEIVRDELAVAESRITERIAALLGGLSAKPRAGATGRPAWAALGRSSARAPAAEKPRFQGRVRARLTPEDVASGRKRVLDAVKGGASTAGEIQRTTALDRHRVTYLVNLLREDGKLRRRGAGRRAKYSAA